jgi:hypothetical protein
MNCLEHRDRSAVGYIEKLGMRFDMCRECLDNAIMSGEVVSMAETVDSKEEKRNER